MSIRVKPYVGLEVVSPRRFPRSQVARILQQHHDWITQQLQRQAHTLQPTVLPDTLTLPAIDAHWTINYQQPANQPSAKPSLQASTDNLHITTVTDAQAVSLLRGFIRQTAQRELPPLLREIADEFDFNYRRVSIRSQKSRWGSCSSKGTISLNDQLLFMPADSVRYLMIHELCHTRQMNHSPRFWRLVSECCVDYRQHEQLLDRGRERVPAWFSHSLFA